MTPNEQSGFWGVAQKDYEAALAIAVRALGAHGITDASACQAGAATVLIHAAKLQNSHGPLNELPRALRRDDAPTFTANLDPAHAPPPTQGVPPCPKCGGAMKVNAERRTDKSPNYLCTQEKGQCGKPSDDGKKWFPSGAWK